MGRSPCCDKVGMKKGVWTPEEDNKLFTYMQQHGHGNWRDLPLKAGLRRCGKSCRLRWNNYLRPDIKRGKFSFQEEQTIIQLHALLGNRWSAIARHLPKRTDNEIKNYWNTNLKKRLAKMGIDPTSHKPMNYVLIGQPKDLSHMAQWETTRIEAEARIVSESKLAISDISATATTAAPPPPPPPPCLDILKVWQGMTWTSPGRGDIVTNNDFFASDNMPMTISNETAASAPPPPPPPPPLAWPPCLDMIKVWTNPRKDDNVVVTTTTPNVGLRAHESTFPNNGTGNDYAIGNYQDEKINGILIENPSIIIMNNGFFASDNMLMTISKEATASAPPPPPPPPPPLEWAPPCLDMIKVWRNPRKDGNVVVTTTTPNVGLRAHENAFPNNDGNDYAVGNYQDEKINGILIENPSIITNPIISNSTNYNIDDYLTSSSNLLATDLQASINASATGTNDDLFFEDNKGNYSWSNILNIVNSPADWPVF